MVFFSPNVKSLPPIKDKIYEKITKIRNAKTTIIKSKSGLKG